MSIQQLPEDVVAQIKSSTTISSLNGVICGLIKNALDAGATKLNVSVDYAKGNCSVEDNGSGILPHEFDTGGGLGKLYYTSRFPASPQLHGSSGTFLASVAALSLLSITSHHENHRSHNSIRFHNSKVLARHIPSPPEQRLLGFQHGTRVTVRDLFGLMPVRVKQRAGAADKTSSAREWEDLRSSIVGLLLPWPGQTTISIRDSANQQATILKNSEDIINTLAERVQRKFLITRISNLLFQAGLVEENDQTPWVALKAATGQLSITGAVCLIPVATKRIQFISLGILPVSNTRGSNVLYEEVNILFANSSFGVEEDVSDVDEAERAKRATDGRYRSEGFTGREKRGRKGIDKWPMFHIRVDVSGLGSGTAGHDVDIILNERRNCLQAITDVLKAMIFEFLKKHHFRPIHYKQRNHKAPSLPYTTHGRSSPWERPISLPTRSISRNSAAAERGVSAGRDLATSKLLLTDVHNRRSESVSPSLEWSRMKRGRQKFGVSGGNHLKENPEETLGDGVESMFPQKPVTRMPSTLFTPAGDLAQVPFPELEAPLREEQSNDATCSLDQSGDQDTGNLDDTIVWVNPTTKQRLIIDARTGSTLVDQEEAIDRRAMTTRPPRLTKGREALRTQSSSLSSTKEASPWIGQLLSAWKNPVFEAVEPPIPVACDQAQLLDSIDRCASHNSGCSHDTRLMPSNVAARISKNALRSAEVISQVDRKFIFAKVPEVSQTDSVPGGQDRASFLVVIDQHAADERCRVEDLMADYFESEPVGQGRVRARARTEVLDKPLQFEVSSQEHTLFERYRSCFEHWGISCEPSVAHTAVQSRRLPFFLKITSLPPSVSERCRTEPRLLIELLRKEIWKLDEDKRGSRRPLEQEDTSAIDQDDRAGMHWLSKFHGCPGGILDMINSRACRSAIMFNDVLSNEECATLLCRLAECAFPFQCAHGRPSMVPLVDMGDQRIRSAGYSSGSFGRQFKSWKTKIASQQR